MEKPSSFAKVVKDMLGDVLRSFPECEEGLTPELRHILTEDEADGPNVTVVREHCRKVLPPIFFDVLYENAEVFSKEGVDCNFLPGIDFASLWKENISDSTRKTIWKYLQLLLFSSVEDVNDKSSFGEAASLFNAISEDEFKSKLEETLEGMKGLFTNDGDGPKDMPNATNIQDHVNKMMGGKLGSLAREIAEETLKEMDIDGKTKDPRKLQEVFGTLMKNPMKLMKMISTVGEKLDERIKSGELKESEMLEEATELMRNVDNMPGMEHVKDMMRKMGMAGLSKAQMDDAMARLKQKGGPARTRDRLRAKLAQRNQAAAGGEGIPREEGVPREEGGGPKINRKKKKKRKKPKNKAKDKAA